MVETDRGDQSSGEYHQMHFLSLVIRSPEFLDQMRESGLVIKHRGMIDPEIVKQHENFLTFWGLMRPGPVDREQFMDEMA